MMDDQGWAERLERQKALIDTIDSRITARARAGKIVELSSSLLRQEERLYRRMLGEAPLHVVEGHAASCRFT